MKFVMALGDLIFSDEEKGFVVCGPDYVIDALEFFRHQSAAAKVLYLQCELPVSGRVGGISQ